MGTVVPFNRRLGLQPVSGPVAFSAGEFMNIDLHFGNLQEH
jgi:hypothetical protein